MSNLLRELFKKRDGVFSIQLFANERLSLDEFDKSHLILRMPIEKLWMPRPVMFQADPFLLVKDGFLFLFYELQYGFEPAKIVMTKTNDLKNWSKPVVVLKEPFHLSFPFVFEHAGEVYMIPESEADNSIRLYRANADLTSFAFVRILLSQERNPKMNCNYVDSHVCLKDGIFYLFTSYMQDWKLIQELYLSDNLLYGVFMKHPSSPICISHEYGRNGGSLIEYQGRLLRVSQDCHKDYGDNVSLHEICTLNKFQYEEKVFLRNIFTDNPLFSSGGHQLNIVRFHNMYIFSTDYKENHWTWWHLYHIMKKIFAK